MYSLRTYSLISDALRGVNQIDDELGVGVGVGVSE